MGIGGYLIWKVRTFQTLLIDDTTVKKTSRTSGRTRLGKPGRPDNPAMVEG